MKKFALENLAKNRLRPEDRCSVLRSASGCDDILMTVRAILELSGR